MSSSTDAAGGEIRVPRETVNDDVVIIATWRRDDGARVRRGECIVEIETSKAVLEVEAEGDGYLQILHPKGAEVPVGELIGRLLAEPPGAAARAPSPAAGQTVAAVDSRSDSAISKKAQRLIDAYALDAAVFAGRGLIRESDVIRYLEQRVAASKPGGEPVEPIAPASKPARPHGMFADARASAGDRGRSLVWLVWNYFWRNWLLGNLVRVAPRGVIDVLHRWRGVKMGRDCFIDPSATLETAYPENITLGNDVRVTVGAIIMTHIKAPNYLRETGVMPVVLKPVRLEDHCFIGVGAVVMPGVTVGKASVVTSGSVVVADVPPYTMVGGNPARVIKRFPRPDGTHENVSHAGPEPLNAFCIDLEEWFHVCGVRTPYSDPATWDAAPSHVVKDTEVLMRLLDETGARATLMTVGWVAERHPGLIRRLVDAGHEIGCHSYYHRLVYTLAPDEFARDVARCVKLLREVSGQPVRVFRAPGFSMKRECFWAYPILLANGIDIDTSIVPARRDHGGVQGFTRDPFLLRTDAGTCRCFPVSVMSIAGKMVPFSGGGYLRLLPQAVIHAGYRQNHRAGRPGMCYIHPREINPTQPRLPLPRLKYFKYYVNLRATEEKLRRSLRTFRFATVSEVLETVRVWPEYWLVDGDIVPSQPAA